MALVKNVAELHNRNDGNGRDGTLRVHSFSDLTHISPVVFLYLLKECYVHGSLKASTKFRALQHRVHIALCNSPQPGPASFVIQCLYVLPIFELYSDGFSHLIISALRRYQKGAATSADNLKAADLAAKMFIDIVGGVLKHDERIAIKILEAFDVRLSNLEAVICQLKAGTDCKFDSAKSFLEQYLLSLIEAQSHMTAVTVVERFAIRQCGQSFLLKMLENKDFRAADKWATFMGKPMLCALVQEYVDRNKLKFAYETIKRNNLQQQFPDVYRKCKESLLRSLAEKALWDLAEAKANGDRQHIEYLVYLAMEAGYSEKVDELCDRYSIAGFFGVKEPVASPLHGRYLSLNQLGVEGIIWVDEADGLHEAILSMEECKLVGLDCEWKPNYEKGSKPNKVSIIQMATEKIVFILDLIKLFEEVPDVLDNCLTRILQSSGILKLGYSFQCDMNQLASSYGELKCFKHYDMLLDIQSMFKEHQGGLSGLTEKILGTRLNKTRQNSNWEQRPLSENQLEYAALDAAVLIHIFHHLRSQSQPVEHDKTGWKSHIISHMDKPKKSKKEPKTRRDLTAEISSADT